MESNTAGGLKKDIKNLYESLKEVHKKNSLSYGSRGAFRKK